MRWLLLIPVTVIGFLIAITIYLQPNDFIGCQETPSAQGHCQKTDAIVAVSGGDTNARTDEAIKLYKNGWAKLLVFSGAAQDKTGPSNAAAMRARAISAGVPGDVIFIEEESATTQENARNTQDLLQSQGASTVILVTSGYHQRRTSLEFHKTAGDLTVRDHPLLSDDDWSFWWWLTPRGWWLAGGEIVKIVIFYFSGDVS
ncbi:MAG: hypothetical protein JWN33_231 [Candidatus Saccharibacteria bacterium]|nr:hypothetical protein [Candidatus Saccharibacteria bacterium]